MKAVVAVILALIIAGGGWLGWNQYQASRETTSAVEAVQAAAARTERQLKAREEDGITFAEYFKRAATSVEAMDQEISAFEGQRWVHRPADRDTAIAFLDQCKAIIRADQASARLLMQQNSAQESRDAAKKELDEAKTAVEIEWTLKRFQRASDDLIEVLSKQISNVEESEAKVKKLLAADDAVKSSFGADKGLSKATVEALRNAIKPNEPAKG